MLVSQGVFFFKSVQVFPIVALDIENSCAFLRFKGRVLLEYQYPAVKSHLIVLLNGVILFSSSCYNTIRLNSVKTREIHFL